MTQLCYSYTLPPPNSSNNWAETKRVMPEEKTEFVLYTLTSQSVCCQTWLSLRGFEAIIIYHGNVACQVLDFAFGQQLACNTLLCTGLYHHANILRLISSEGNNAIIE